MNRINPQLTTSPLPKSIFWRFFWFSTFVAAVTALAAIGVSRWMGRVLVYNIQDENGYTVLRNAADIMGRTFVTDELLYSQTLQLTKENMESRLRLICGYLDSYETQFITGTQDRKALQKEALARLTSILRYDQQDLFIADHTRKILVPPRTKALDQSLEQKNSLLNSVLTKLHKESRYTPSKQAVYAMYQGKPPNTQTEKAFLLAAMEYKPWGIVLYAGVSIDHLKLILEEDRLSNLNELRARLAEIVVGRTGYLYFFDEDCMLIGHPTINAYQNIDTVKVPGQDISMCTELKKTAEKPWGQNKFQYKWDHPNDEENFIHPKISWVTHEPITGWYIATSAYIDELEESLPQLQMSILLPALVSILFINFILALLLRKLLSPIKGLTAQCKKVAEGDLSVQADADAPGEIGFLCRHFNTMVTSLRQTKRLERDRHDELIQLNKDLEYIVEARTSALKIQAEELEEANRQLVELDEMKSSFLSSVSHELRTPLTSVLGFTKLINKEFSQSFLPLADDTKLKKKGKRICNNLEIIEYEGQRLTRMINDFLDLAKIESGRIKWSDSEVDPHLLLHQVANAMSGMFADKAEVVLIVEIPQPLPLLYIDPDRLEQVVINLLNNAAKFTTKGSVTLIARSTPQGKLQIRVEDTGPGIPAHDQKRIFDKFHQVVKKDTREKKTEGTGLGLSISQEIVKHYHGRIWVESVEGEGSSFIVELPTYKK
ncbi:ATP-binding protein [uncultured Pseudodesulfovibrio sp.]|uniref:ATP-binding protein n=1 Tax=uncultured Pseudodesulfovibrio sp. TaxID=2035858 RepID=UPI0029C862A7|nr:ATP-binding protein [uncultured Pseudodesulfovibrio sp.]